MPDDHELTFTDEAGYLRVTVTGEHELDRALRGIVRVGAEASKRNAERVLLDTSLMPSRQSTLEKFRGAEAAAVHWRFKCAILSAPDNLDHFAETVARNRGASVLVFTDEQEALAWLLAV